jgi:uncharacterized protein
MLIVEQRRFGSTILTWIMRLIKFNFKIYVLVIPVILMLIAGCASIQRNMMYYPTHKQSDNGLERWEVKGEVIGYCRKVAAPKNVWLMFHGNGGQASDRAYAIPSYSPDDSVYIMEYPGYGLRKNKPSEKAINRAATEAYSYLRSQYTNIPVCVAGESIGSGPASLMAKLSPAPDKIVLIVPFDRLSLVAKDHFPSWLVWLIMRDDWDNMESLSHYTGPVEIFGAKGDTVIPVKHAKHLSDSYKLAVFKLIDGGHNDWSYNGRVVIRNP